jgi:hypothetical protein
MALPWRKPIQSARLAFLVVIMRVLPLNTRWCGRQLWSDTTSDKRSLKVNPPSVLCLNITPLLFSHTTYAFPPIVATRGAHEYSEGELFKLTAGYRSSLAARPKGVHLPPWHTGQSRLGLNCISKTMPQVLQTWIFWAMMMVTVNNCVRHS